MTISMGMMEATCTTEENGWAARSQRRRGVGRWLEAPIPPFSLPLGCEILVWIASSPASSTGRAVKNKPGLQIIETPSTFSINCDYYFSVGFQIMSAY